MTKLTLQEEEAMQVIWQTGGGVIKDFLELLKKPRPPYTTLASTVKNLEKKGYVKARKAGNTNWYEPALPESEYKRSFMSGFVEDYFKNSYKELVTFFAKDQKISPEELKEIIHMIEKKK
ncbi:putative transcriptional regulator [Anseongella ginsenosidimutans]|uniref:Putative transcriptional regulator n=1 Tax=Anseongella ginsenosidimutans TaxID=496056 RepID=A0A4R3KT93_9SPHI|nr:BlaI/MecI/CopY family transcriptional regulator [Anseongella ginsenosidimutans]QEC53206.1 BlaI/MecI/CopY family transcriptional regulator [Anseongella ginsenosidimutans]TCS87839.1 putative transcriptional regulator [Anseongella ginsenosidimutans]